MFERNGLEQFTQLGGGEVGELARINTAVYGKVYVMAYGPKGPVVVRTYFI